MARPGVKEEEVFKSIEALMKKGTKLTVESVRAELGHGAPNTILRHLRTWRNRPVLLDSELKRKEALILNLEKVIQDRDKSNFELKKSLKYISDTLFNIVSDIQKIILDR